MKKSILSFGYILVFLLGISVHAQQGIGTNTPSSAAVLELKSNSKGFLPPRLSVTEIESIVSPPEGLTIYCTDCDVKGLFFFNGVSFLGALNGLGLRAQYDTTTTLLENLGIDAGTGSAKLGLAELNAIVPPLADIINENEAAYQDYVENNADRFASPATLAEVQAAISSVNSDVVLTKIATQQSVTLAELEFLATTGRIDDRLESYNNYILKFNDEFSAGKATLAEVNAMYALLTTNVVSSTGKIWMDRNLGASRVATASNDHLSYGNLYQWGRASDGHEVIVWSSSTTSNGAEQSNEVGTQATTTNPSHGGFITIGSENWTTSSATLWQGANGVNNPCPTGFRIPTATELDNERVGFSQNNSNGAFNSVLKLPVAGYRSYSNGSLGNVGGSGYYWSSTFDGAKASGLSFDSGGASILSYQRALGFSVRCIKE